MSVCFEWVCILNGCVFCRCYHADTQCARAVYDNGALRASLIAVQVEAGRVVEAAGEEEEDE